jgi:uncharacterized protein YecE (DUF72 family)
LKLAKRPVHLAAPRGEIEPMPSKVYVGTSGWTYDDWSGPFYPEGISGSKRLEFYAEKFDTVEVNATFYRLPTQTMIDAWNRRLKKSFHLVLKGSRLITHRKKLANCEDAVDEFFVRALKLDALRVVLWQLPPSIRKDAERLDAFLCELPGKVRYAVEFRHKSWWDDEVADVLAGHDAAFAAISHPSLPADVLPTTDLLYLRFHGIDRKLYRYDYTDEELSEWVDRVKPHLRGRTLYAFFNNDYHANAPKNAAKFRELLQQ